MKTFFSTLLLIRLGLVGLSAGAVVDLDPQQVSTSGVIRSVIVQGQHAYCGIGSPDSGGQGGGLRVFDVSNPANPVPVAFYEARADVSGLAVAGSHAYLGSGGSLIVIDISNPANPRPAGRYDGGAYINSLVLSGNHAYLAGGILQIVDVSDPANPQRVGTYGSGKNVVGVSVAGNYAYLANNFGTTDPTNPGFEVLDISNPAAPQSVGGYGIHLPTHVFAFGNYAYVGWGSGGRIVDISNPSNPQFVRNTQITSFVVSGSRGYTPDFGGLGILDLNDPANSPRLIARYTLGRFNLKAKPFISGNYAYLAAGTEGLLVVDISNFVPPSEWKGRYEFGGSEFDVNSAFVSGNTAYVGARSGGFHVVDIRNPATPQRLGSTNGLGDIQSIYVSGNHAYVATRFGGMQVVDVSNPVNPRRAGGYEVDFHLGLEDVSVAGNHAFLAGDVGFLVLNVSNPAQPQLVWEDRSSSASGVFVSSNVACVAGGGGLRVFDASNPANPQLVGSLPNLPYASYVDVFMVGPYACLVGESAQSFMDVVDISSPSNPHRAGRCLLRGSGQRQIYVSGNRAFTAGHFLEAVDVSDPANPRALGIYDTFGLPQEVFVSGPYACLPDGSGMQILDVSLPPNPKTLAGEFDTSHDAVNVVISGNRAIVGNGSGGKFDFLDVSDRENPRRVGSYHVGGDASGIFFRGDYAFLTDGLSNVHIVDVSNPALPKQVGGFSADSLIGDVFVSGDYAHAATKLNGVQVFDVSDPANPQRVARYGTNDWAWGVFVSGNHSYVWSEAGAEIFDVSDPGQPRRVSSCSTNPLINSVFVFGNYACVGASDGMEVFNVSNPANPQRIGGHAGGFNQIIVSGERAYVSNGDGLNIYDLSDPTQPRQVGFYRSLAVYFAVSGDCVFLAAGHLDVVNVGNPANPQRIGAYAGLSASAVRGGISVSGSKAFVAGGTNGLQVLDVSNPANPQRIGGHDTPGSAEDVAVSGKYAYVADWYGGLQVINVSNPANPQFTASLSLPDYNVGFPEVAERVVVSGDYACVTGYALHVIDVRNPAQPLRVGGARPAGGALSVFVSGQLAYVGGIGLHVYDLSDPANPQRLGGYATGDFYDVFVSSGIACVAAKNSGLWVFDVSNPTNPRRIGIYEGGKDARSVHVVGHYAYVMDRMSGLYVLDVSDPALPRRVGGNPNVGDLLALGATDITVAGDKLYLLAGERGFFILDLFRDPNSLRLELLSPAQPGPFRFQIHGPPGMSGRIQRSTSLQFWEDWMPFTLGAAPLEVTDPAAGLRTSQFYRAISP